MKWCAAMECVFSSCGIWHYVSVVLSLYTHGRINGFSTKGLILVGVGRGGW